MTNTPDKDTRNYPEYARLVNHAFERFHIFEPETLRRIEIKIAYNPKDLPLLADAVDIAISTLASSQSQGRRRRAQIIEKIYVLQKPEDIDPEEPQIARSLSMVAAQEVKRTYTQEETSIRGVSKSRIQTLKKEGLSFIAQNLYADPAFSRMFDPID